MVRYSYGMRARRDERALKTETHRHQGSTALDANPAATARDQVISLSSVQITASIFMQCSS